MPKIKNKIYTKHIFVYCTPKNKLYMEQFCERKKLSYSKFVDDLITGHRHHTSFKKLQIAKKRHVSYSSQF